jgi:hypothetical protein
MRRSRTLTNQSATPRYTAKVEVNPLSRAKAQIVSVAHARLDQSFPRADGIAADAFLRRGLRVDPVPLSDALAFAVT